MCVGAQGRDGQSAVIPEVLNEVEVALRKAAEPDAVLKSCDVTGLEYSSCSAVEADARRMSSKLPTLATSRVQATRSSIATMSRRRTCRCYPSR